MYYIIQGLCPRSDLSMGAWGFSIGLYPEFKKCVALSGIDDEKAYTAVSKMGRHWLDGCGFDGGFEFNGEKEPLYKPNRDIRVQWGEWGPEHIVVPGNACGLDIGNGFGMPAGSMSLHPHNVDTMSQAMMLLMVFTWFTETITILGSH